MPRNTKYFGKHSRYSFARSADKYPEADKYRRPSLRAHYEDRWRQRDDSVHDSIARLPLLERIRSRMTGRVPMPPRWRSFQVLPYLRLRSHLEYVRMNSLMPKRMHDVLDSLDAATLLWPGAVQNIGGLATRQVMAEMNELLAEIQKISFIPTTTMSLKQQQIASRLGVGAQTLTEIMKPQAALPAQPAAPLPALETISVDRLSSIDIPDDLMIAVGELREAVISWQDVRSKVEPPSVRSQVDYLVSKITASCRKLQEDPSIAGAPEARDRLQEIIEMTLIEIERVMRSVEQGKVDSFLGDLSALRSQIRR